MRERERRGGVMDGDDGGGRQMAVSRGVRGRRIEGEQVAGGI